MLFYTLSELFFFFGSSENIEICPGNRQKSNHKQQETRKEGKKHNLE
jgi:hypothetical protein